MTNRRFALRCAETTLVALASAVAAVLTFIIWDQSTGKSR